MSSFFRDPNVLDTRPRSEIDAENEATHQRYIRDNRRGPVIVAPEIEDLPDWFVRQIRETFKS